MDSYGGTATPESQHDASIDIEISHDGEGGGERVAIEVLSAPSSGGDPAPVGARSGSDTVDSYLRAIRRIPLLSHEETLEYAYEIREQEWAFRQAMYAIPATAIRAFERWSERRAGGYVTGLLCHAYRDDPSRDWSSRIDRSMKQVGQLLEQRSELARRYSAEAEHLLAEVDSRIASSLTEPELHVDLLLEFFSEFRDLLAPSREREITALRIRMGFEETAARDAFVWAQEALERRDEARRTFANHNLRLVIKLSRRYAGLGVPYPDLIQEGNLGLLRAVEKFDPSRGFRFSTYAVWWIEQSMIRAVQRQSRTVRVPAHVHEQQFRFRRAEQSLRSRLGREPGSEDLAAALEISQQDVEQVAALMQPPTSLEAPIGDDGMTFGDLLTDEIEEEPCVELDRETLRCVLERGMRTLKPRERRVLKWRFGLHDGGEMTLQQIGKRLGLSRERVRQIESVALDHLRQRPDLARCADSVEAPEQAA
jgi:RNA polymerase sigma factor (sigma-70 family)